MNIEVLGKLLIADPSLIWLLIPGGKVQTYIQIVPQRMKPSVQVQKCATSLTRSRIILSNGSHVGIGVLSIWAVVRSQPCFRCVHLEQGRGRVRESSLIICSSYIFTAIHSTYLLFSVFSLSLNPNNMGKELGITSTKIKNSLFSILSHLCVNPNMEVYLWPVLASQEGRYLMEFSSPEYWSGQPFPSPGDLPNPGFLHCRWILYQLSHEGSPRILEWVAYPFSRGPS